jgi:hypothetical protein
MIAEQWFNPEGRRYGRPIGPPWRRIDLKRLTFSRGLLIGLGTVLLGAALGWIEPPAVWVGLVGVGGFLMFLLGLRTLEVPDPCGDPEVRLRLLAKSAHQLAHNLAHFSNWWPAVKDESFDGMLPDGRFSCTPSPSGARIDGGKRMLGPSNLRTSKMRWMTTLAFLATSSRLGRFYEQRSPKLKRGFVWKQPWRQYAA